MNKAEKITFNSTEAVGIYLQIKEIMHSSRLRNQTRQWTEILQILCFPHDSTDIDICLWEGGLMKSFCVFLFFFKEGQITLQHLTCQSLWQFDYFQDYHNIQIFQPEFLQNTWIFLIHSSVSLMEKRKCSISFGETTMKTIYKIWKVHSLATAGKNTMQSSMWSWRWQLILTKCELGMHHGSW